MNLNHLMIAILLPCSLYATDFNDPDLNEEADTSSSAMTQPQEESSTLKPSIVNDACLPEPKFEPKKVEETTTPKRHINPLSLITGAGFGIAGAAATRYSFKNKDA